MASDARKKIILPDKLVDVFTGPALYRVAYGGRGSGKTRTFAKMAALRAYQWAKEGRKGVIVCGREFQNSLLESSFAEVREAILEEPWLAEHFDLGEKYIRTADGNVSFAFIGLRHNLQSLKSTARVLLLWVDEAEPLSDQAWMIIDPTVREEGSEVWVTYNPAREESPTNKKFRLAEPSPWVKIAEVNWRDNPWFPQVLEIKRQNALRERPDQYEHIWEGAYVETMPGAYYAAGLTQAKVDGRIGFVPRDTFMADRIYCDLGGTGAKADAFVMVHVQFVGQAINFLDCYEAIGQEAGEHLGWLRAKGLENKKTLIVLPHDGTQHEKTTRGTWKSLFQEAGYHGVRVLDRVAVGAASKRVEAVRRLFPRFHFNEPTTKGLRKALGWYHEKIDDNRQVGMGPDHDWSSNVADAVGAMATDWQEPSSGIDKMVAAKMKEYQSGIDRAVI